MRRKLAAGNWKMNGLKSHLAELDNILANNENPTVDLMICPPATLLSQATQKASNTALMIGGQDCHANGSGAHTGDISAAMLADAGAGAVIVGHSERREDHNETDTDVRAKSVAAMEAGLISVTCLGESLAQREAGDTLTVIGAQLAGSLPDEVDAAKLVIAYEPIWAIGTGKVPTLEQIIEVHDCINTRLIARFGEDIGNAIPLLYGGSVKPDNAATIFKAENVDGALVGGASLKASDFAPIIAALAAS